MEWSVLVKNGKDMPYRQPGADEASAYLMCRDDSLISSQPLGMLTNGGRLYIDVGAHPEYATPEDDTHMGTVANEFAGENIMFDALSKAKNRGLMKNFLLNKRVVDDGYNTWGYHMSLCADAERLNISSKSLMPLGMHLATINVFAGAGAIVPTARNGTMYTVAQKSLTLNRDFGLNSHHESNPLVSLRQEALADNGRYERIHITSLDANMSPWATWMKLGTTSIVLHMLESGYLKDTTYFENDMHEVASMVACDTTLKKSFKMEDGTACTAIDIQTQLMHRAKYYAKDEGLNDEELHILSEWERALSDLRANPELLQDRVDWIAKRAVLRRYIARHALSFASDIVREKDRQWSYIGPLSIGGRLRETLWSKWMPPQEHIDYAYRNPPKTTRAVARAALIRKYALSIDHTFVSNWDLAQTTSQKGRTKYIFNDPYQTEAIRVDIPPSVDWRDEDEDDIEI